MANVIIIKHSEAAGHVPAPGSLVAGQIAINSVDKKLFWFDGSSIQSFQLATVQDNSTINALIFG